MQQKGFWEFLDFKIVSFALTLLSRGSSSWTDQSTAAAAAVAGGGPSTFFTGTGFPWVIGWRKKNYSMKYKGLNSSFFWKSCNASPNWTEKSNHLRLRGSVSLILNPFLRIFAISVLRFFFSANLEDHSNKELPINYTWGPKICEGQAVRAGPKSGGRGRLPFQVCTAFLLRCRQQM